MSIILTPFIDQALEYVDSMGGMTSGELTLCHDLCNDAARADADVAQADSDMAKANEARLLDDYCSAHEKAREAFEDGSEAVTRIRSLIRNANARRARQGASS